MRPTPPSPETTVGAWLTLQGKPIAMRDCDLATTDAAGKPATQKCLFIADSDPADPAKGLGKHAWNYTETKAGKGLGGFDISGVHYHSPKDYFNKLLTTPNAEEISTALWAKYTQNADLRQELITTGNAILVCDSCHDGLGIGPNGTGNNDLGCMLMLIRDALKKAEFQPDPAVPTTQQQAGTTPPLLPKKTPTTTEEWAKAEKPLLPNLAAELTKWQALGNKNTTANFTRAPVKTAGSPVFDDPKATPAQKQQFIEEAFLREQAGIVALWSTPHFTGQASVTIKTTKNAKTNQDEPEIHINGDQCDITFIVKFDRGLPNAAKKPHEVTLTRTKNADGTADFAMKPNSGLTEQQNYELMAAQVRGMREQDRASYDSEIRKLTANLTDDEEKTRKALTRRNDSTLTNSLNSDETSELQKLNAKKNTPPRILTKGEEDQVKKLQSFDPGIITLEVEDKFSKVIDVQKMKMRDGLREITLTGITKKQADVIMAFLENHKEIHFTPAPGMTSMIIKAPPPIGPGVTLGAAQQVPISPLLTGGGPEGATSSNPPPTSAPPPSTLGPLIKH